MRQILATLLMIAAFAPLVADAATHVRSYTRKNGTHVQAHYGSDRNTTRRDNWTTKGNSNPYM